MAKFDIIYADPAWSFDDKLKCGDRGASQKYRCMSIEEIKAMPVQSIASDNCILFLWVVFPLLQEGLDTIGEWGFTYKTAGFNWIKTTKNGKLHFGMGHYTRAGSELCLIGIKGKPKRVSGSVRQVLMAGTDGVHSKKPDMVPRRIVELMGDRPRIELFGRKERPGWVVLGNEIDGMEISEAIRLVSECDYEDFVKGKW